MTFTYMAISDSVCVYVLCVLQVVIVCMLCCVYMCVCDWVGENVTRTPVSCCGQCRRCAFCRHSREANRPPQPEPMSLFLANIIL